MDTEQEARSVKRSPSRAIWMAVVVCLATVVSAVAVAAPANAAPSQIEVSKGLQIGGFDRTEAAAHGYVIVTLPDGGQTSVLKQDASAVQAGTKKPSGAVYYAVTPSGTGVAQPQDFDDQPGTCGDSYVYLWADGGSYADMGTGFIVRTDWPPVGYINWRVTISDNGGTSSQTGYSYSGGWSFRAATRKLHLTVGPATATVPWYSIVVLNDGTICYSLQPTAHEDIV